MLSYLIWWVLAAVLIGVELLTGTFYLLAVGFAFVVGGLVAWMGGSLEMQLIVGGVLSVVGVMVAHQWRLRHALPVPQVSLDLGQAVRVQTWRDDGTARVEYRGTQWDAEVAAGEAARAETMYIVGVRGSTLVIAAQRA
jgi:membrane protein implicated in regulation of membrane protease activity